MDASNGGARYRGRCGRGQKVDDFEIAGLGAGALLSIIALYILYDRLGEPASPPTVGERLDGFLSGFQG